MSKRIAIFLLAIITAFAGVSICPRGVRACSVSPGAAHKCCGQAGALRKANCCKDAAQPAPTTAAARIDQHSGTATLPALVTSPASASITAHSRTIGCGADYGPAPPGTLLTHHTALLL
jgi:hypothetical protein